MNAPDSDITAFYSQPILNSPYAEPDRHWELDKDTRQPTQKIINDRRPADFIAPVPLPKKRGKAEQATLALDRTDEQAREISDKDQEYVKALINEVRGHVKRWRNLPRDKWQVTSTTAKLLEYWRSHQFGAIRPFFCQIEAVETAIWLTEVAPKNPKKYGRYQAQLEDAAKTHNPGLPRLALKMATGSGKTTVMAMLIAWQTLNAVREKSGKFTNGFLVVAPGITIRDRLQVLKPGYPGNYYESRELVPRDTLADMRRAVVAITNYHAFMPREKSEAAKITRGVIEGWKGETVSAKESPGEIIQRVMPDLARMENIIVINDEAHHCYREKPGANQEADFLGMKGQAKADAKNEAASRAETARVWISGLEMISDKKPKISRVFDLSATPFFLAGSGYREGTIFPWTVSDFSLMDAIECGIVKLPRIPVLDDIPELDVPMYRDLWRNIRDDMPKKGSPHNPVALPPKLKTALESLYGHYSQTFAKWRENGLSVPPSFIIVCNNTATSKQVYDYISGYWRKSASGEDRFQPGRCGLFSNYEEDGAPLARPRTLLIDSAQLERGDLLDSDFRAAASAEIESFKKEAILRGDRVASELRRGKELSDAALLREAMNTVGKKGQLGADIRCVVSVGMLSEGWDANNVTHILGVRAFGTQLLCEQVIGRALRRQSYELNGQGLLDVEYADALGIPFDFSAKPEIADPKPRKETTWIRAISPERDRLAITFPRVAGYRTILPPERLEAEFTDDSRLFLTPELVGATKTENAGIIGESVELNLKNLENVRANTVAMHLARYMLEEYFRDEDGQPKLYLYGQLRKIIQEWMRGCLKCAGGAYPANLLLSDCADLACERVFHAINRHRI